MNSVRYWAVVLIAIAPDVSALQFEQEESPGGLEVFERVQPPQPAPLLRAADVEDIAQAEPPEDLTSSENYRLTTVVTMMQRGEIAAAKRQWAALIRVRSERGGGLDANALVNYVIGESYVKTNPELRFAAERVRRAAYQKAVIRDYLGELRDKNDPAKLTFENKDYIYVRPPRLTPRTDLQDGHREPLKRLKRSRFEREWKTWSKRYDEVVVQSEEANVDLQQALQSQRHTHQAMSDAAAMLHDTARTVIRNVAGASNP